MVLQDRRVPRDRKVWWGLQELMEPQGLRATRACLVLKDNQVPQELQDSQEPLARLVYKDPRGLTGRQGRQGARVTLEPWDQRGLQEHRVKEDLPGHQVALVL